MTYQKRITCGAAASIMASMVVASVGLLFSNPGAAADDPAVKRGQYLVQIGGCNDCHTAGYGGPMRNLLRSLRSSAAFHSVNFAAVTT